jgi:predicted alpha-1,2-mannosidase
MSLLLTLLLAVCGSDGEANLSCVDPTIGGVGIILQPTRPTVHLPNSMVRSHPMKADQLDDQIQCFPLTVASHRVASVFSFLPVRGEKQGDSPSSLFSQRRTYEREETTPYYYGAEFEDGDTLAFAPAERSGYFLAGDKGRLAGELARRADDKKTQNAKSGELHGGQAYRPNDLYLRLGTVDGHDGEIEVVGPRSIRGVERFNGMQAYFYAETDADLTDVHYRGPKDKRMLVVRVNGPRVGFRYGVSYISVEQAKANLEREIPTWDFEAVREKAKQAWIGVMSRFHVEGGTPAQRRVFFTALYRCYERMVDINEHGRYYSAYDRKVHESNKPFYVDNWLWDTCLALEPLHMILDPAKEAEKIRSYLAMYEQGGWMPSFGLVFGDWPAMTGNNAAIWIADAWFKGIHGFDFKKAYAGIRKNSVEATLLPWRNGPPTSLDVFYNEKGYMPGLRPGEKETVKEVDTKWEKRQCVSVTLDNSYSDWCIAQLASCDGNHADRELFLRRAKNYKNVFRVDKGFVWPKDANGQWIEPFSPKLAGREYFTENNAYTYNWDVRHDLEGLFRLMGGRARAEAKLDQLFREDLGLPKFQFWTTQPDSSGLVGQFVMGNEPSFHIPYIYNYLGAPWKTQKRIRMLLDTWFTDNLFGMPGDEDGGGMSAFVVFSMMGFFPVTPGVPVYNIGSPVFDKVSITLPDGKKFTVKAVNNSAANKYIQSARLDGAPRTKPWFTHAELCCGGTLELTMGPRPNKQWGSGESDAPPSSMDYRSECANSAEDGCGCRK